MASYRRSVRLPARRDGASVRGHELPDAPVCAVAVTHRLPLRLIAGEEVDGMAAKHHLGGAILPLRLTDQRNVDVRAGDRARAGDLISVKRDYARKLASALRPLQTGDGNVQR
jgi:hypothetical protein